MIHFTGSLTLGLTFLEKRQTPRLTAREKNGYCMPQEKEE